MTRPSTIVVLNSLDERYGSTYRIRALQLLLRQAGHRVVYTEGAGPKPLRLVAALRCALGSYDLFVTQKFNPVTLIGIAVARLRGRPVLVDWDDLDPGLQGSRVKRRISQMCEWAGPRMVSVITTHSRHIQARAIAGGVRAFLVPQGFDPLLFRPTPETRERGRARFGITPGETIIGHLCTFTHGGAGDLAHILEAWRALELARARFLLVGGGPLQREVEREVRRRGLAERVIMTGLLAHEEVPLALAAMDVGVVWMSDSASNRARASFKVLEYLAMGIPVAGRLVGESEQLFGELITRARGGDLPAAIVQALKEGSRPAARALAAHEWGRVTVPLIEAVSAATKGGIGTCA